MVSAGGRVFTIVDEGPPGMAGTTPDKWFLVARDAFNGIELWRKPITDWGWRAWSTIWNERFNQPNNVPKRLVAVDDRVYVTLGFNAALTALDAATGEVVKRYEGTEFTDEILYQDGLLILSINKQPQGPGEVKDKPPVRKYVAVFDAKTGERLWTAEDFVGNSTKTGPVGAGDPSAAGGAGRSSVRAGRRRGGQPGPARRDGSSGARPGRAAPTTPAGTITACRRCARWWRPTTWSCCANWSRSRSGSAGE